MARVLLVHWNATEAEERAELLRGEGFEAESYSESSGDLIRAVGAAPPDAIVIDLARIPSHGCAVGIAFRQRKSTRQVPLVFMEGDAAKTARVRVLLPDAVFTTWAGAGAALRGAIRDHPAGPFVPDTFAGYAGTPLAKKLRIGENSVVALLGAPPGFESCMAPLPEGVRFEKSAARADVILAFTTSAAALRRKLPALVGAMREGRTLWLVWPKKTSALAGDLGQTEVRRMGLAAGLVDYKICEVDRTWSGLAFAVRSRRVAKPAAK